MAIAKSTRARARRPYLATNPLSAKLLLAIWEQLDPRRREQLLTAAFGMLKAQVGDVAAGRWVIPGKSLEDCPPVPEALQTVLFRSDARDTFDKVLLCGSNRRLNFGRDLREGVLGRRRRPMRWLVNGNLIAPDWRVVRVR